MSRQNVYDEAEFFAGYSQMRARRTGLHERVVDGVLRRLLPDLAEKRVVDLGCGDGWACRVALELGAAVTQPGSPQRTALAFEAAARLAVARLLLLVRSVSQRDGGDYRFVGSSAR